MFRRRLFNLNALPRGILQYCPIPQYHQSIYRANSLVKLLKNQQYLVLISSALFGLNGSTASASSDHEGRGSILCSHTVGITRRQEIVPFLPSS